MNAIHAEKRDTSHYLSLSFAATSVIAAVLLVVFPMLALLLYSVQL